MVSSPQTRPVAAAGGAARLRSPNHPDRLLIDDHTFVLAEWQTIARASLDQFTRCLQHPYAGWVYLSPPALLEPGEGTGRYRRGTTTLFTDETGASRIVAPDLALAVVDEVERRTELVRAAAGEHYAADANRALSASNARAASLPIAAATWPGCSRITECPAPSISTRSE